MKFQRLLTILVAMAAEIASAETSATQQHIPVTDGPSIQKAIDSRPGQVVFLPPGDYEIAEPIVISHHGSGLVGPGRIIQTNPKVGILVVSRADGVQLRDFILTRASGVDGAYSGLIANSCRNLAIDNVQVINNRAASSSINIDKCVNGRLTNSLVRNYARISVDDRTANPNYGFAFKCFDGTGIHLTGCQGILLQGNRVEELYVRLTKEAKEKYALGKFTTKNATKGPLVSQDSWDNEQFPQWHQGSAIHVSGPHDSDQIQLIGNFIENAAQGIDIHSDHVIVSQNIVNNAAVGVKAMHGSRNVLVVGNQFNRCCAHAILLQPGASSHAAGEGVPANGIPEGSPANHDGGSIIANNIISDFGYGDANWIWGNERDAICLEAGQTAQNPPLSDVIVQGNIVYDPGRDKIIVDGKPSEVPPRYRYALVVSGSSEKSKGPIRLRIFNNILHPGRAGVSNIELGLQ